LWRRLQQNQQWQQAATRIANSVQFGEAQHLCQSIAAALPQDALSAGQLLMWQKAVTAEHTDQEQLQLFDTLVLAERDKQAQQLIWRASTDCSLAVAISPFALADMLLVVWRSSRMLRQLAVLYGSPVGQLRSLAMLKRALAALLWAGGSELVLDIGSGLGYSAAVIARLAEAVVAVESDEAMAEEAQAILSREGADNVILHHGPLAAGAPQHGPYDAIIIQGAVGEVPGAILEQLKDEGRIACLFMEGALGVVRIGYKLDGGISWRYAFNASAPVLAGFEKQVAFSL
jgi:protein-L-isoaspartate O-methyltransferase